MATPLRTAGPLRVLARRPPPASLCIPLGGRASTDASGSALRLREEDAEATTPSLTEPAAVVADGAPPRKAVPARGPTWRSSTTLPPGECLSKARYRLLHNTKRRSATPRPRRIRGKVTPPVRTNHLNWGWPWPGRGLASCPQFVSFDGRSKAALKSRPWGAFFIGPALVCQRHGSSRGWHQRQILFKISCACLWAARARQGARGAGWVWDASRPSAAPSQLDAPSWGASFQRRDEICVITLIKK